MIFASILMLLTAPPQQNAVCADYRAGTRQLATGEKSFARRHHAEAYRQFSQGLKVIDRAYAKSFDAEVLDDTGLKEGAAYGEARQGRFKAAAHLEQEILSQRLATIDRHGRCTL